MQNDETFFQSDLGLFRQLVRQFFTRRRTRELLMGLSAEQRKDLGLTHTEGQSENLFITPPW